jgi:hypothetical protein
VARRPDQEPTIPLSMSSMDIDLPLEDVIKNTRAQKKSASKKKVNVQKRAQQKKNGPSLGPKQTGKFKKTLPTKGPGRVGPAGDQKPKNVVTKSIFSRPGITTVRLSPSLYNPSNAFVMFAYHRSHFSIRQLCVLMLAESSDNQS